jgi:hypothetical protein
MVVSLVTKIPTLGEWLDNNDVGMQRIGRRNVYENEYLQIKTALKRKTVKQVAIEFNRCFATIYKISKEKNENI